MKSVAVIGATSPLGTSLVSLLVKRGYKVLAGYRSTGNLPLWWKTCFSIECIKADLENNEEFVSPFKGADFVIWLAHCRQGRRDLHEAALNIKPFGRFLGQLDKIGTRKVVFVSSGGSVYGRAFVVPVPETHPRQPLSSYGKTKKIMEDVLMKYGDLMGFDTAIIRPGNIYGPECLSGRAKGVVTEIFRSLCSRRPFTLRGDETVVRDFVHIDDVSRAALVAMESPQPPIIWNVGSGIGHTVSQVMHLISEAMCLNLPLVVRQPAEPTDVPVSLLSVSRIMSESIWRNETDLEQGIHSLVKLSSVLTHTEKSVHSRVQRLIY